MVWTEDSEFRIAKGKEEEMTKVQTCALASASDVIRPTVIQPDHGKIHRPMTVALCGNYKKKLLLLESRGDFPPTPFLNHSLFKGEQDSWLGITKSIKPVFGSVPFLRSVGKTQGQLSEATSGACQGSTQEAGASLSLAPKAYYRDTDGASSSRKLPLNL